MLLAWVAPAFADYSAPPPAGMLAEATGIVYATVTSHDAEGHAHLQVHEVLAGKAATELTGTSLSCFGMLPELKDGHRYVILLQGDQVFEETSWFEVRGDVQVEFWTGSDRYERAWMPLTEVRARVKAAR